MKHSPRILFVSHGGGPRPLLGDDGHQEMVDCLTSISSNIEKPSAIIMISAHWEENIPTITSGKKPPLIYDYYGFPEEAYTIQYPCPGETKLAEKIHKLLKNNGIESKLDEQRGFDHGMFVPLKIMYPAADIPCVQLSLVDNLDPVKHLEIGSALRELDYDNLLIIGSGFSFHNTKAFYSDNPSEANAQNELFEHWLIETCSNTTINEDERKQKIQQWTQAPAARFCHPREEHLLPLHVCYGIAESSCTEYFELSIFGKKSSMYLW